MSPLPYSRHHPMCMTAQELHAAGYIGLSNKYRIVARIDRPDWLEKMAGEYHKAVADFYVRTGDGFVTSSTGRWGEHYCAVFSKDKAEGIEESVYRELKKLWHTDVTYVPQEAP